MAASRRLGADPWLRGWALGGTALLAGEAVVGLPWMLWLAWGYLGLLGAIDALRDEPRAPERS